MGRTHTPLHPDIVALIVRTYSGGASCTRIAKECCIGKNRVADILKQAEVPLRSVSESLKGNKRARKHVPDKPTLYDLYVRQGKTVKELVDITGNTNIFWHLKEAGIPLRTPTETMRGRPSQISADGIERIRQAQTGPNNSGWKGGKLPLNERNYQTARWKALRTEVLSRDDYTCQTCGERFPSAKLRAHHMRPRRYGGTDIEMNLITLCNPCHRAWHIMLDELQHLGRTPW